MSRIFDTFNMFSPYLAATYFLDRDNPRVIEYTNDKIKTCTTPTQKAEALYYAVRDDFQYNPYLLNLNREALQASHLLTRDYGYCVEKAVLLATAARAANIPSRLSFYIVTNHIATETIEKVLGTNLLVFHGAAELYLNDKWIKYTPAFNAALCHKLGVAPIDFQADKDCIFQEYTPNGNKYMTYIHDYGNFEDMPYILFIKELRKHYPQVFSTVMASGNLALDLKQLAGL